MPNSVAIMDFGSEKIKVMVGARGVNNTIIVKGVGEENYTGFSKGEFFQPQLLFDVISKAIKTAQDNAGVEIVKLYIGVPAEFSLCLTKESCYNLDRKRKITQKDIDELYSQTADELINEDYIISNIQPIYYTIDNERTLVQPIGNKTTKLNALLSIIQVDKYFVSIVDSVLAQLHIDEVEYVSSPLASALLVLSSDIRAGGVILIDIGYLTTSVCVVKGEGLLDLKSFSLGGGHITGDLATCLSIPFTMAENLKKKAILSIIPNDNDVYEVVSKDVVKSFSAKTVNDIILERIKIFGRAIEKCLSMCEYEIPKYTPYFITGGGISYIRGAKELLSNQLDKKIELATPTLPQADKPIYTSSYGVMNMALDEECTTKKSFFARLFSKQ